MNAFEKQVGGSHYKDMPIQVTEFCQRNQLNHIESCIVKYACRHKRKNGRQDVEKIIHYAELLLDLEYPEVDGEAARDGGFTKEDKEYAKKHKVPLIVAQERRLDAWRFREQNAAAKKVFEGDIEDAGEKFVASWVNKATHEIFERRQQGFSQSYCYSCGKDAHGNLYCADCEAQRGA